MAGYVNYDRPSDRKREAAEAAKQAAKDRNRVKLSELIEGVEDEDKEVDYDQELIEGDVFSGAGKRARRGLRALDDDSDEEANKDAKKVKPAKQTQTMRREQIEGQEESTGAEFDTDGTRIEPFNMNEELEEGDFDEKGFYTLKQDAKESHDPWLDSISAEDIRKGREAKERHDRIRAEQELDRSTVSVKQMMQQVVQILQPNETPLKALARLGGPGKTSSVRGGKKAAAQPDNAMQVEQDPQVVQQNKRTFEALIEACDRLVGMGEYGIYSDTREDIDAKVNAASRSLGGKRPHDDADDDAGAQQPQRPQPDADSNAVYWQYKWAPDGEVFGPFSSKHMDDWANQGAFGDGVLVRKIVGNAEPSGDFYSSKRVDFSLYTDDD